VAATSIRSRLASPARRNASSILTNAKLLALIVNNAHFGGTYLSIRAGTGWDWRTVIKWSSRYGRTPPYFFLGPLLTIGGFGADLVVRLPPRLDIAHLLSKTRDLNQVDSRAASAAHASSD